MTVMKREYKGRPPKRRLPTGRVRIGQVRFAGEAAVVPLGSDRVRSDLVVCLLSNHRQFHRQYDKSGYFHG